MSSLMWSILNILFILFGTCGNVFTFFILIRKNVRKHSHMRYLASITLIDTLCLYTWNFSYVYQYLTNKKIENEGRLWCRLFSFFCYFILQSSSWIMCLIGIDRMITVILFNKINFISKITKNAFMLVTLVLIILCLINLPVLINNAMPVERNSTQDSYRCYEPKPFYFAWDIVHIILYSLLPFCIIFLENITLSLLALKHSKNLNNHFKKTSQAPNGNHQEKASFFFPIRSWKNRLARVFIIKKNDDSNGGYNESMNTGPCSKKLKKSKKICSKGSHVANLLLFLTISFFFTTVPYSMFYALKLNVILNQKSRRTVLGILTILQYLRHSSNFLIYLLTSTIIKNELKEVCTKLKKKFSNY